MNKIYSIIDTETTGLSHRFNKIIDIAVISVKDGKVINKYQTLVNPNQYIPKRITSFTGINNEMVNKAPNFFDISYELKDLIDNTTVVAHNAPFDIRFIEKSFNNLDLTPKIDYLCTINLCRKLYYDDLNRFNLDTVCRFFKINIKDRHRALGDAEATAEVFIKIWKENFGMWEEVHSSLKRSL